MKPQASCRCNELNGTEVTREDGVHATWCEVARCAQAVLTALNVGAIQSESPLHLKLREVMIAYRASGPTGDAEKGGDAT